MAPEGTFEMVEHSDVVEDQCQDAVTALTDTEKKVQELEKRLEEKNEKEKELEKQLEENNEREKVSEEFCVKPAIL